MTAPAGSALELDLGVADGVATAFELRVNGRTLALQTPAVAKPPQPNRALSTATLTFALPREAREAAPPLTIEVVGRPEAGCARLVYATLRRLE